MPILSKIPDFFLILHEYLVFSLFEASMLIRYTVVLAIVCDMYGYIEAVLAKLRVQTQSERSERRKPPELTKKRSHRDHKQKVESLKNKTKVISDNEVVT